MTLEEIIIKAIPAESCPQKNANAMHRRKELSKRIDVYIKENYEPINNKSGSGVDDYIREVLPVQS